jgi:hypothetical protein
MNSTGFTVSSYFSGRWGRNLCGQTTIRSYGASTIHPPYANALRLMEKRVLMVGY